MYVCVCKGLTKTQVEDKIGEGCCTLKMLVQETSAGKTCGSCIDSLKEILTIKTQQQGSVEQS